MSKDLLTKEEIAREMSPSEPLSQRSVLRYIQLAGIKPAVKGSGRGKQAKYRRKDVENIKAAYKAAAESRTPESRALTATKRATLQPVAIVGELVNSNVEGFQKLQAAIDTWPTWLTKVEAIERTGIPITWFDVAVGKDELPHVGEGRGRRFHRDDVRALAERLRENDYRARLFGKSAKT
jgi:hypothetical protein